MESYGFHHLYVHYAGIIHNHPKQDFCCCHKEQVPNYFVNKKVYFSLQFHTTLCHWGKSGQEPKAGTLEAGADAETMEEYCLLLMACQACFLIPKGGTAHREPGSSSQSPIKTMYCRLVQRPSGEGIFLSWGSFFQNDSSLCQPAGTATLWW